MTFSDKIEAHFTANRWGILQYLLAGMVDPTRGIFAPFGLVNQGYGDDMLQLRFLIEVLRNRGIADQDIKILRCRAKMKLPNRPLSELPFPGIGWQDDEGSHLFSPSPFYRFASNRPELNFETDPDQDVPKFMAEMQKLLKWNVLRQGQTTTDACIYTPANYPNCMSWDSETNTMLLGIVGTHQKPGIGSFYFQLSEYGWEGQTLVVQQRAGFSAEVRFAHLHSIQMKLAAMEPLTGLEYLIEQRRSEQVPSAGMDIRPGNDEMFIKHAPLFIALICNTMTMPERQQATLFQKISAASKELALHEPPTQDG